MGATDAVSTVTATLCPVVVLHVPTYLTKYVVLVAGAAITNGLPLPAATVNAAFVYHSIVAPVPTVPPTAVKLMFAGIASSQ